MEPIQIPPLRANDPTARSLLPQPVEADEVLDDRDGSQQGSTNGEDGIGGQLVASEAVPHAKVEADGHEDAVDYDKTPEPEDGLLADPQAIVQGRWSRELGVRVGDLGVRKLGGGRLWGGCTTGVLARVLAGGWRLRRGILGSRWLCVVGAVELGWLLAGHLEEV